MMSECEARVVLAVKSVVLRRLCGGGDGVFQGRVNNKFGKSKNPAIGPYIGPYTALYRALFDCKKLP